MRVAHYTLMAGIVFGAIGFTAAAFLDKRQLGMMIFMIGFFAGAVSAVYIALTGAGSDFGKIGMPIKIASSGFGLILFGQLLGFLLDSNGSIGNTFFSIGIAVMMVGILAAAVQMAKQHKSGRE